MTSESHMSIITELSRSSTKSLHVSSADNCKLEINRPTWPDLLSPASQACNNTRRVDFPTCSSGEGPLLLTPHRQLYPHFQSLSSKSLPKPSRPRYPRTLPPSQIIPDTHYRHRAERRYLQRGTCPEKSCPCQERTDLSMKKQLGLRLHEQP